jgi:hypothetical protein
MADGPGARVSEELLAVEGERVVELLERMLGARRAA